MVEVVAAIIGQGDNILICQRPANKGNALRWEFPGGKLEPGETLEQALIRECREELDVTLAVGERFGEATHAYPDITVHLTFFLATIASGTPRLLEHRDLHWVTKAQLTDYDFCPADAGILRRLQEG